MTPSIRKARRAAMARIPRIRTRRGPLRLPIETLPDGTLLLECGHTYTPDPRCHRPAYRRRCAFCPYECGESRAAWERDYKAMRRALRLKRVA